MFKAIPLMLTFLLTLIGLFFLSLLSTPSAQAASGGTCSGTVMAYWKLDDTSPPPFTDSANNNSATCTDCPTISANGQISQALSFDGTDDTLTVASDVTLDWAHESLSVEVWVKSSSSGSHTIIGKAGTETSSWYLALNNGNPIFFLRDSNGVEETLTGTSNISDDEWHHLAGVWDETTNQLMLYVDGTIDVAATVNYSGNFTNSGALTIGSSQAGSYFDGDIDEIALHREALPSDTIRQHVNDGTIGLGWGYCTCNSTIRIMPLGDSITYGTYDDDNPDQNNATGYRRTLYSLLTTGGYTIDFVGSLDAGSAIVPAFDTHHEGHGGFTPKQVRDSINTWLTANPPDVVLLHIGTNGINNINPITWTEHISETLIEIDNYNSGAGEQIPVLVARIINHQSGTNANITTLNNYIQTMADTRLAQGDKLLVVDQENALTYPDDMHNTEHPTDTGYIKMANTWFDGLDDFLPTCTQPPLAVQLASFDAYVEDDYTQLNWRTISEIDNLGFNLWRSTTATSPESQLNSELIPSQAPGSGQGFEYEWLDHDLIHGTSYYWLEDIDIYGQSSWHGPISATRPLPTALTLSHFEPQPHTSLKSLLGAALPLLLTMLLLAIIRSRHQQL